MQIQSELREGLLRKELLKVKNIKTLVLVRHNNVVCCILSDKHYTLPKKWGVNCKKS